MNIKIELEKENNGYILTLYRRIQLKPNCSKSPYKSVDIRVTKEQAKEIEILQKGEKAAEEITKGKRKTTIKWNDNKSKQMKKWWKQKKEETK